MNTHIKPGHEKIGRAEWKHFAAACLLALFCGVPVLLSGASFTPLAGTSSSPATSRVTAGVAASIAPERDAGWLSTVQQNIALREYHVSDNGNGLQAPNRAHNLRTYFDGVDVTIEDRTAQTELLALRFGGLYRGTARIDTQASRPVARANRIHVDRGPLTEWYVNSEAGLKQGFDIGHKPAGDGWLEVSVQLGGARARVNGNDVTLRTDSGRTLRYAKLVVTDANGVRHPAHVALPDPHTITLVVDDSSAQYPLTIDSLITSTEDALLESNQAGAALGISVAGAGDVNGDGYADVIVGAWAYDFGQSGEGAAFVYHGSAAGVSTSAATLIESDEFDARMGFSVAGAGDVNGDGYADVIVGAHFYGTLPSNNEGAAFVFHGSPAGIPDGNPGNASASLETERAGMFLGVSVAGAGDVNGDGYDDVVVGASGYDNGQVNEGAAFVYLGSKDGVKSGNLEVAAATLEADQDNASMGLGVAGAGDVNGDGYADVIVGAYLYDNTETDEGVALIYHGSATGIASGDAFDAATALVSGQAGAAMGFSVAGAGDVNGDGFADVIVGASSYDNGQSDEGAAFVYLGSATGIATGDPTIAAATIESDQSDASLGISVAGAGDVNGDGYADVVVGANQYDRGETDEGVALVFFGSATGIAGGNPTTAEAVFESDQADAGLGRGVAGAGDVNGDGYADIIAGATSYENGEINEGAAFVYHGSAVGIASGNPTTAAASLESDRVNAGFAWSVAGSGDVNGDGYADLIVGAKDYDNGQSNEGAVFVYHGTAQGIDTVAAAMLESNQTGALLGASVAGAGDVNGDGFADVILGAYLYSVDQANEGLALVYHGSASGIASGDPATAAAVLESDQAGSWAGFSVAGAGDVNGDGYADVIVGAYRYDNGDTDEGAAFVFHGSASGITSGGPTMAATIIESDQADAWLGWSVAGAGDVNGDGFADVIVSAIDYDNGQVDTGAAFIFHGAAAGISSGNPGSAAAALGSGQTDANFGISVDGAGDVNGDGYGDVIVGANRYDDDELDEGVALVYHGSATGIASGDPVVAAAQLESNQVRANLGTSVAGAGDVNGDGYADVIVGAVRYDNGEADEGVALVYHGSASGIAFGNPSTAAATLESDQEGAWMGSSVAGAGDVNGDGFADVVVGASQFEVGQGNQGAAFVFHGNRSGRPVLAQQRRADDSTAVAAWGASYNNRAFIVEMQGTHPDGLARVRLQIQACGTGVAFGNAGCIDQVGSWARTDNAAATLTETVSDLTTGALYRWRARVQYAPLTATPPLIPSHGPWRRFDAQAGEADVRTLLDTTEPTVIPPDNISREATGPVTAVTLGVATVTDNVNAGLTASPDNTGPFAVGIHLVTWSATDSAGNTGTAVQAIKIADSTAPTVTITGANPLLLTVGDAYDDPGATATDLVDGDLTAAIVTAGTVDTGAPGSYSVTYTATDAAGNAGTATRVVNVSDVGAPVITPPADITVEATGPTTPVDLGTPTVTDDVDTGLTATPDNSGPFAVGLHLITWTASDSSGNVGTATQTVTVTDTTPPSIALIGADPLMLTLGQPLDDPGATAMDLVDGDLSAGISVAGTVDVNIVGEYTLTYSATDAAGNSGTAERAVIVRAFTVGGAVNGLTGTGLVLRNNGGDDLFINADGGFVFMTPLADGAGYVVTIASQPDGQVCSVSNGSGTVAGADVTDVLVSCGAAATDLAVSITDNLQGFGPGDPLTYQIGVVNNGPIAVVNATVTTAAASALLDLTWECLPGSDSACTGSGSGDIDDLVSIPVGGSVNYVLTGITSEDFEGVIETTVTVTPPPPLVDLDPANNSATDLTSLDGLFSNGFESPLMQLKRWLEAIE